MSLKSELLQIYNADTENDEADLESPSPLKDKTTFLLSWEELQNKIKKLEEENVKIRSEAAARAFDIENEEKKEMQLINDCAKQLGN